MICKKCKAEVLKKIDDLIADKMSRYSENKVGYGIQKKECVGLEELKNSIQGKK